MLIDQEIERITADIGLQEPFARWKIARAIESAATAPLLARIAGLEKLCDETYVKQGADAYNNACDEMERWQKQRKADGKEVGTTGSLCDGIAWLYLHVSKLEQQLDVMAKNTEAQAHASVMREIELTEKVEKLTRELEEARKDAERWNWLNWHIGVAWGEEGFTSLIRIVSEKHRALINTQVDKLMSGELPEAPAIKEQT